jgi:hypothetical protein
MLTIQKFTSKNRTSQLSSIVSAREIDNSSVIDHKNPNDLRDFLAYEEDFGIRKIITAEFPGPTPGGPEDQP